MEEAELDSVPWGWGRVGILILYSWKSPDSSSGIPGLASFSLSAVALPPPPLVIINT